MRLLIQLRKFLPDKFAHTSYSQEGEDIILRRLFDGKKNGFYIDVGAHHPRRFSNTYLFYLNGWRGINIEPNSNTKHIFNLERPRDINLQFGVSDNTERLKYYQFDEPALNTFDEKLVKSRLSSTTYQLLRTDEVPVDRLENILEKYLPKNQTIDFLNIDTEGLDLAVLQSNDWSLFRPRFVLAESLETSLQDVLDSEIFLFMVSQRYELFAKTYNTLIFRCKTR